MEQGLIYMAGFIIGCFILSAAAMALSMLFVSKKKPDEYEENNFIVHEKNNSLKKINGKKVK